MKARTIVLAVLLLAGLATVAGVSLVAGDRVSLAETWVSDTARENRVNHHGVGVGPDGAVLAPVAAVVKAEPIGPTSCSLVRLDAGDGGTVWRAPVPPENCTTHAITAPAVADVDEDGAVEAVVGTTEHALIVREARTGDEEWRVPLPTFGYGRPAVANVTSAPGPEVVGSDIGGSVLVATDGGVEWRGTVDGTVWATPVVADVDDDGDPEVVVGSSRSVTAFEADGSVAWRAEVGATTLARGQVDGDAAVELVATDGGRLTVLDGKRGDVEGFWEADRTVRVVDVADADDDGRVEAYVGLAGGDVAAVDLLAERVEWTHTVSETEQMTPAPRVADVTGDGAPEVVAASNDGTVAVLDPDDGEQLDRYVREVLVWVAPTTADVDGDGAAEIFVRYGDGRVVRLDAT